MFGIYRFLLAHMVVLAHLWRDLTLWSGVYAVFSFFALSGYLMAMALQRTYGFSPRGLARYVANRALRIYPPYLAVLAVSIAVIVLAPAATRSISLLHLPQDGILWLRNIIIFSLHLDRVGSSLIPPAWSIDLELCFYLAMGLLLARSRRIVTVWFVSSLAYAVYALWAGHGFDERYSTLPSASLPYSAGAMLYHYGPWLRRVVSGRVHAAAALLLYLAHAAVPYRVWSDVFAAGFYASLVLTGYCILALGTLRRSDLPRWLVRTDTLLGNLSYPVFLCHWPMAVAVVGLGLASHSGRELFLWTLPFANGCAYLVHRAVEQNVDHLRDRVRGRARPIGD